MNGGGVKIQAAHLYPKTHVETPTPVVMDLLFQIFFFKWRVLVDLELTL